MSNQDMRYFASPPDWYTCSICGASGVKLWRDYESFSTRLRCAHCAGEDQKRDVSAMTVDGRISGLRGQLTDTIGWCVPAIPVPGDSVGFWGYTSVPQAGVEWWRQLPNEHQP
jgi:hypothetical protein